MEYCSLPMDPVLENIKLRILKRINSTWDTNYNGGEVIYNLSPKNLYDVLTVNILSYTVTSTLVGYKTLSESNSIQDAFLDFLPVLMAPVNIECTAEGGYDLYLAVHNVKEILDQVIGLGKNNKVSVKIYNATGTDSKHVYVEFNKRDEDVDQKLLFIIVVKSLSK